jgi:queuine tRNA-ribosyltransferase
MAKAISFQVEATCPWSGARVGTLVTKHGSVDTPAFMPVGTQSTVKTMSWDQVEATGSQIVLANAYHMFLRPGHRLVERAGGLHKFMSWNKPVLTDSGGYQVFSLENLRNMTPKGVHFKNYLTGQQTFIGPAESMQIQNALGADIIMAFDHCVKNPATFDEAKHAMETTHRWLIECIDAHQRSDDQALFGIVQGSIYPDLRTESARIVTSHDLEGFAIGGVAVGEQRDLIEDIVLFTAGLLPAEKPRYLMGIGTPWDVLFAIRAGMDMFDCTLPTRLGRHGGAFSSTGRMHLKNANFREDWQPIEADCDCYTCRTHSRGYLHHLCRAGEILGASLLSIHNIHYLHNLTKACRNAILQGTFKEFFESRIPPKVLQRKSANCT